MRNARTTWLRGTVFSVLFAVFLLGVAPAVADGPPVEVPLFFIVEDVNPCTGETILLTFEGVSRVHQFDDHLVIHFSGTVTTSDGYAGTFRRQLVLHGDQVTTVAGMDMEVGPDHERVMFRIITHVTVVNGEVTADFEIIDLKCIGKP